MEPEDVIRCSLPAWYPKFKNITFHTKIIELPSEVEDYLLCDGIVLPEDCDEHLKWHDVQEDNSEDEINWDDEDTPGLKGPSFPEFNNQISKSIADLGGQVLPKLNWSTPKDATWIALNNTLKCSSPRDVYLLLKGSNFVAHDLTEPFKNCKEGPDSLTTCKNHLILRRWHDIHPAGEFRCFVRNHNLIGICQRNNSECFSYIKEERTDIISDITKLYTEKISKRFGSSNYVFDVYREKQGVIFLVDFNPYGPVTDALLFDWDDLEKEKPLGFDVNVEDVVKAPVFWFVQTAGMVASNPYRCYSIPQDFRHLSTGEDPNKLVDFLKMKIQSENNESSSDEDDSTQEGVSNTPAIPPT